MSPDDQQPVDEVAPAGVGGGPGEPSEEELRAAYEAELSRLTSTDVMAQAVVSLLNIGARRLAPGGDDPTRPPERDLQQARDAIDAVRALLEILERRIPRELTPLRDALSRLQMAYAHEVGPGGVPQPGSAGQQPGTGTQPPGTGTQQPGTGTQPPTGAAEGAAQGSDPASPGQTPSGPGPAESSGRLWVPGR